MRSTRALGVCFCFLVAACGDSGQSAESADSTDSADSADSTGTTTSTDDEAGDDDACGGCPDGSSCIDGMCQSQGCDGGCPGLSYCDLGTQTCQPGCAFDDQCTNGVCDVPTHSCVCDDGFEACGTLCIPSGEICEDSCGDGVLDANEVCDGAALGGATCESLGFVGGQLACAADCASHDTSACTDPACGDGMLNGGEACDGNDLGGASCESLGFEAGSLACNGDCTIDDSGCGFDPLPDSGLFSVCGEMDQCAPGFLCGFGMCTRVCSSDADCAGDFGGNAVPTCSENLNNPGFSVCLLACDGGLDCPDGTFCDTSDFYAEMLCRVGP